LPDSHWDSTICLELADTGEDQMGDTMIQVDRLTKIYPRKIKSNNLSKDRLIALDSLCLDISHGEIFGLLGPNGSGKTTTVKLLATLVLPTLGTAYVNGHNIITEASKVRVSIGLSCGNERSFCYRLSGWQNLEFFGALQGLNRAESRLD
jgi:ABC-2 type transport system ATP-binding protein